MAISFAGRAGAAAALVLCAIAVFRNSSVDRSADKLVTYPIRLQQEQQRRRQRVIEEILVSNF